MTASEKRLKVRNKYKTIIGRNIYSQPKRDYCYKKYSDGKYYSDCSSSVSYTYKECGYGFGIMRTTDMYISSKFTDVPVKIKNGIIQNPEVLRVGDMLLFAGNDAGRKKWGYVGHVEMVGEINGSTVMLYGHGSGNPKRHEMNAYCKSRYNTKASTPLGRRLLIKVRRFIQDDVSGNTDKTETPAIATGAINVRHGNYYVRTAPDKSARSIGIVHTEDQVPYTGVKENGWYQVVFNRQIGYLSVKAGDPIAGIQNQMLTVKNGTWYIRVAPGTSSNKLCVVHGGDRIVYTGDEDNGWYKVYYDGNEGWISSRAIVK